MQTKNVTNTDRDTQADRQSDRQTKRQTSTTYRQKNK